MPLLWRIPGREHPAPSTEIETALVFQDVHDCGGTPMCGSLCPASSLVASKHPLGLESGFVRVDIGDFLLFNGRDDEIPA